MADLHFFELVLLKISTIGLKGSPLIADTHPPTAIVRAKLTAGTYVEIMGGSASGLNSQAARRTPPRTPKRRSKTVKQSS
jgi:hypothetical protein